MVKIIGHRGGRNIWPENSLSGFRNLAAMPVEGVEFDVHLTKSGELLVIHDPTLERTTDGKGEVADLTPESRKAVTLLNSDGETIPTLAEVLDVLKDTPFELHVELKADASGEPYVGLEAKVAAMLDEMGLSDRSIMTSFNPNVLAKIREVSPDMPTLSSFDSKSAAKFGLEEGIATMQKVADYIAVEKSLLGAHWDKITAMVPVEKICVWVPNEMDDLTYWLAKPVGRLTTDRPDLAISVRSKA